MDKEYWLQKWQSEEIGFNQLQPNKLMQRYFSSMNLKVGCRVFVPLCGQSVDMIWLMEQGYQVVGVEFSEIACRTFFEENKIAVKLTKITNFVSYQSDAISIFCGDLFKLDRKILGKIDAIYDRAALIALPKEVRKTYSKYLVELTPLAAVMFLITTVYDQNEMQGPPFSVNEDEVIALYSARFEIHQVYSKQFEVPLHLQKKGLTCPTEQAYRLSRKKNY